MAENASNPWKLATIAILLVLASVVTTVAAIKWFGSDATAPAQTVKRAGEGGGASQPARGASTSASAAGAPQRTRAVPAQATIDDCNRYASAPQSDRDKYWEIGKDAVIGGVGTAAVGAAAGAIADGGKGAGKGAAIGGILGAIGGTLYGVNENRKTDEGYRTAYARCMHARGYTS